MRDSIAFMSLSSFTALESEIWREREEEEKNYSQEFNERRSVYRCICTNAYIKCFENNGGKKLQYMTRKKKNWEYRCLCVWKMWW